MRSAECAIVGAKRFVQGLHAYKRPFDLFIPAKIGDASPIVVAHDRVAPASPVGAKQVVRVYATILKDWLANPVAYRPRRVAVAPGYRLL